MNFLEQLAAEWYAYNGYFVRTNVKLGLTPNSETHTRRTNDDEVPYLLPRIGDGHLRRRHGCRRGEAAHAVIREAKDAGVYVFGGGINEDVAPLMVAADGTVTNETYPQTKEFDGGFCVLELPSREAAVQWAAKIAKACRCSQELREFGYDPES